jgi:hypothetical protein
MKKLLVTGLMLVAAAQLTAAEFSKAVAPAEFAAAGLGKLTPEELARLDALVRDFKDGALTAAREQAAVAEAARAAAEAKAAQAETAKAEAETKAAKAEAATTEKKPSGGIWAKAKVLLAAGTEIEYTPTESRIAGDFTGWSGRSVIVLENGQRWQIANGGSYITPPIPSPKVTIFPAKLGGFWMKIEGVGSRVKVVLVESGN